uniref:Uncharacterized protein n=1 Tax=Mycena chlorophos TaxID=658473 RepID=A0ABQ0L161_MYCCL|nr:predicted protein [Mycena chlorophos]
MIPLPFNNVPPRTNCERDESSGTPQVWLTASLAGTSVEERLERLVLVAPDPDVSDSDAGSSGSFSFGASMKSAVPCSCEERNGRPCWRIRRGWASCCAGVFRAVGMDVSS